MNILLVGGCGYIGSHLYQDLSTTHRVDVVDLELRGNPLGIETRRIDYRHLSPDDLAQYDAVLWFAGHSSVANSFKDPVGALRNNCLGLIEFALRLPRHVTFVYASTASLYSKEICVHRSTEDDVIDQRFGSNPYDVSKFAFDYLAKNYLVNFIGLRLGTLCGWSANFRSELVFNAMHCSAVRRREIVLMNKDSRRSILYLSDLARFIRHALGGRLAGGFYNASSETYSMEELATAISRFWGGVPIRDRGRSQTYSFMLDNTKFLKVIGVPSEFGVESRLLAEKLAPDLGSKP